MTDIDIASRFAIAILFGLLALVLLRDHRNSMTGVMAGLFAIAACADQITTPFGPREGIVGAIFQAAGISGVVWLWLLAKSLFDDAFRWRNSYFIVLATLVACSLGAYVYTDGFRLVNPGSWMQFDRYKTSLIPQQTVILGLAALTLYEVIKDWHGDLVESRRRFRQVFLLAITLLLIGVSFTNYLRLGTDRNEEIETAGSLVALAFVVTVVAWLLSARTDVFSTAFPSDAPVPADDPMICEIRDLMNDKKLFMEHGLTIGKLAEIMNDREYRLRRTINGSMGYRNFSQFLNHFRIEEASQRLADPANRRLPILTIAIDVGYASLAPFNKAFKAVHGMTPTEYRRQHGV